MALIACRSSSWCPPHPSARPAGCFETGTSRRSVLVLLFAPKHVGAQIFWHRRCSLGVIVTQFSDCIGLVLLFAVLFLGSCDDSRPYLAESPVSDSVYFREPAEAYHWKRCVV